MTHRWENQLSEILAQSRRAAFVGVGQELRGDDAAGLHLVRSLQRVESGEAPSAPRTGTIGFRSAAGRSPARLFFDAGSLPEACAGPLRRFRPDWVIFLDAAEMREPPGTVRLIEPQHVDERLVATHTFPMAGFAAYLSSELHCRVAILGIQPKQMEFDAPVSAEVRRAIEKIAARIAGG